MKKQVTKNNIKELEKEIHKLEHELYPAVVNEIATKKIFLSDGEVIRKQ